MKKIKFFAVSAVAMFFASTTMAFASDNSSSLVSVPESLQKEVLQLAVDNNAISQRDAKVLLETNAAQQCLDAFISSGFQPSAAVDKLAEIGVEAGYYSNVSEAKANFKSVAENLRKNEANWAVLYKMLGL